MPTTALSLARRLFGRPHVATAARRDVRARPSLLALEARDVPALYLVSLAAGETGAGTKGEAGAEHTGSFAASATPVEAATPAEAVSLALTGSFTVTLPWSPGDTQTYTVSDNGVSQVGTSPGEHLPFVLVPQGGDSYQMQAEDLARIPYADWDYNDRSWQLTVQVAEAVAGVMWSDTSADGIQDDGEPMLPGLAVQLLKDGTPVGNPETTGADGAYSLAFVRDAAASYAVSFELPSGSEFTTPLVGDPTVDSNADALGMSGPLPAGTANAHVSAGVVTPVASVTTLDVVTLWPEDYIELPGVILTVFVAPQSGSGVPTGTVTFTDNGTAVGTAAIGADGTATLTIPNLAIGDHPYVANYAGDVTYLASMSLPTTETLTLVLPTDPISGSDSVNSTSGPDSAEDMPLNSGEPPAEGAAPPAGAAPQPGAPPKGQDLTLRDFRRIDIKDLPPEYKKTIALTSYIFTFTYDVPKANMKGVSAGNDMKGYTASLEVTDVKATFVATFDKNESFVQTGHDQGDEGAMVLEHEIIHMMIAEYVAAKASANFPLMGASGLGGKSETATAAMAKAGGVIRSSLNSRLNKFLANDVNCLTQVADRVQDAFHDALNTAVNARAEQRNWYTNFARLADPILASVGWIK